MDRPAKTPNLIQKILKCIEEGRYLDTRHVIQRQVERGITRPEVLRVLGTGYHEKRKDQFIEEHNSWNYALRGKTIDARLLRVIVSFDENNMLIITAIELGG